MKLVAKPAGRPNGIALSPNGRTLYVVNSDEHNVRAYDLDRNGDASNERVLISGIAGVPDGIAVDEKGNLYVAAGGIAIYSPEASARYDRNDDAPSNCAFGEATANRCSSPRGPSCLAAGCGAKRAEDSMPSTVDDRRYPKRPLVGVGALILRRDRILMAQRGKEPLKGWWSLPGGALEIGESLDDAVRREVREETGLEVAAAAACSRSSSASCAMPRGAPEYHYVLIDYICRVTGRHAAAGRRRLRAWSG